MPWYKLELKGGRGHANQEVEYMWSDLRWNTAEKQAQWDSWSNQFGYERMWDGHVTYVKRLPVDVRDQMITMHKLCIEEAQDMIIRLTR